jgi:type IV pilus assembly protein PilC
MMEFHYVARDEAGRRYAGSLKSESKDEALKAVSERYPIVTRLEHRVPRASFNLLGNRIKGEDILGFCETLSAMLEGGVNLKSALDTLLGDTDNPALRNVIMDLTARVGSGDSLSAAMSHRPDVFDSFFVNMMAAGESSGELPEMVRRVAAYLEKTEEMKEKVRSALTYPAVVLAFAGLLVAIILTFGVPYLQDLYDGLGIKLPLVTQILATVGSFLNSNLILLSLMLLGLVFLGRVYLRTPRGQLVIDKAKLNTPVVRGVFNNLYTSRFARTLALLYSSGIPVLDALDLTSKSIGNQLVADTISQTQDTLRSGGNLSDSLRMNPYFSNAAIGLVSAGEEAGKLDVMLLKVAAFYDRKVDSKLEALTSTIEPIMMVGVGIVIGGIIIALGLPFLTLASNF